MDNVSVLVPVFQFLVTLGIFAAVVGVGKFIVNNDRLRSSFENSRFFKLKEYFPVEKISYLKQLFYLVMILIFLFIILYLIFGWEDGLNFIFVLDIILSAYLAINAGTDSFKDKFVLFLLIPFASISALLFEDSLINLFVLFHIFGYLYYIQVYYRKFFQFTKSNALGITVILLFSIILVSFLFTILAEDVSPLDSITMVSNAFTSNSFDASGNSTVGKLNSLVLAWGGFLLSGVGTATLAVSMVLEYVDREFDDMENLIKNKKKEKKD